MMNSVHLPTLVETWMLHYCADYGKRPQNYSQALPRMYSLLKVCLVKLIQTVAREPFCGLRFRLVWLIVRHMVVFTCHHGESYKFWAEALEIFLRLLLRNLRVKQIKRSFVAKCMVRISQATLFAMKLFSLVYRMSKDETSSYYFFHSHVMLYVTTGLYSATAVTTKSDEALAYFNLQHAVCKQFLGTCSIFWSHLQSQ